MFPAIFPLAAVANRGYIRSCTNGVKFIPPRIFRQRVKGVVMVRLADTAGGFASNLETLEPRLLMSGDVTVRFDHGDLRIIGDRQSNQVKIDCDGLAAGQFRVSPLDADTTINGQSAPIIFEGVTGTIRARMGADDDVLELDGRGSLPESDFQPFLGSNADLATRFLVPLLPSTPVGLDLHMGRGNDTINMQNFNPTGRVFIRMGAGDDTLHIAGVPTSDFFDVSLGSGDDTLIVDHVPTLDEIIIPLQTNLQSINSDYIIWPGQHPHTRKIHQVIGGGRGHNTVTAADGQDLSPLVHMLRHFQLPPTPVAVDESDLPQRSVSAPSADKQQLVKGNNDFAFDLYHQLQSENGNIFFSPLSISTAMAMLYTGAAGQTAQQIAQAMSFDLPQADLAGAFGSLLADLALPDGNSHATLDIANSTWGQKGLGFLQSYLDTLAGGFGSQMHSVDFRNDPEAQRQAINNWVSDNTGQMIQDLLPPGSITSETLLTLANAIYFKADWVTRFEETVKQDFHLDAGNVQVDMMKATSDYLYSQGDGWQAVEIPYVGDMSMVVLLPAEGNFQKFDSSLTAQEVADIEAKMSLQPVNLSLPKFDCEDSTNLGDTLAQMGITDAFKQDKADLSGIDGKTDLYVSDVLHKAKIEVTADGTKAAAATAIILVGSSSSACDPVPPPPVVFNADRPFEYIIKDNATGSTLFVGRVSDATAFA